MIEKGKRMPNWQVRDTEGNSHGLWNYRQKSHVVLLYDPAAPASTLQHWQKAVQVHQKQWDWLNTKVLIITKAPEDVSPGAYVVDRYGMLWNYFSPSQWTFDGLERDLVYYEARHC